METRWIKHAVIASLTCLFLGCPAFAVTSTSIVISQAYSSQNSGSLVHNDFVELFNLGATPVNLAGWTLQVASEDDSGWTSIPLSGNVAPGQYFLIAGAVGTGNFSLPAADLSNSSNPLDPIGGRLALVNTTTPLTIACVVSGRPDVVDFVNYGSSSTCSSAATASMDTNDGIIRGGGGCLDTGNNSDFSTVPPYPRSSTSPLNACGSTTVSALESFSIPSNGGASMVTSGSGTNITVGSGTIQPSSGNSMPSGVAIFGFRENNTLITEAGVPAAPLVQNALVYVQAEGSVNTGIAINNPNNQDVTISFNFNSANTGFFFPQHFGSVTIPAKGQLARFVTELPYAFASGIEGTILMTASAPVGIVALRGYTNERNEFLVTTLPVIDLSQPVSTSPAYLAHFAAQGGWSTQVILVNPGGDTVTGTVSFTDPEGNPLAVQVGTISASSVNYSIASLNSQSFIVGGSGTTILTGSINVSLTSGPTTPVAVAVFSYVNNNVHVTEAGLVGNQGTSFRTYVQASGTTGTIGSIQSGLAIANTGTLPVTINLQLFGLDGSTGLSTSFTIPASGQTSRFLNQLFPTLPTTFEGFLQTTATGPISMVGLRGRYNERDDFLITTIPPISSTASTMNQLVFPHLADSGGYTTQFVLFGPTGQSGGGSLLTLSPGGQPLPLQFNPD